MATINKQMKTFNVPSGSDTVSYEIVDANARDKLVNVSETQPEDDVNKLWIHDGEVSEYTIPTIEEFNDLSSALNRSSVFGIKNLFDKNNQSCTTDGYYNTSNTFVQNASTISTGYIPVEEGKKYTASHLYGFVLWYDANKSFLSFTSQSSFQELGYAEAVENAEYARFLYLKADANIYWVSEYPEGQILEPSDWSKCIEAGQLTFSSNKNLYIPSLGDHFDGYYNTSNTFVSSGQLGQTDFIPVNANYQYSIPTSGVFALWYDAEKTFIGSTNLVNNVYYPLPKSQYGKFIFTISEIEDFYIYSTNPVDFETPLYDIPFESQRNLFNPFADGINMKGYTNTSGAEVSTESDYYGLAQSDFIPVEEGFAYTSPLQNVFVLWFDSSKELIGNTAYTDFKKKGYVIPIDNAKYSKWLFYKADRLTFYVKSTNQADIVVSESVTDLGSFGKRYAERYNGKVFVSFGDSITYQNKWQPIVAGMLGLEHHNCGIGGTCMSGDRANTMWFDSRLEAVEGYDPDVITILAGANDQYYVHEIGTEAELTKALADKDKGTFIGAYSYVIEKLLTWKPTVTIIILGTTFGEDDGRVYSSITDLTYTDYSDASRKVAAFYGLPFVDLHGKAGFNNFTVGPTSATKIYSDDRLHPNWKGAERIAKLVLDVMINEASVY